MAAHCTDTHAQTVHGNRLGIETQYLVGLRLAFPLFLALAVAQVLVDPRNQAARQRHTKIRRREFFIAQYARDFAVDIEDGGGRIIQQRFNRAMRLAHLCQQFTHILRTRTGCRLIGHRTDPLHQICLEQAAQRHQHQADGAIAADKIFFTVFQCLLDYVQIHRIKNNHAVFFHAQGGRSIDPVALPASRAQLREDLRSIVAALAGNDRLHRLELIDIAGIFQWWHIAADIRRFAAHLGGGKKYRIDQLKIALFAHTLHQHRTHHTAPTDQTYSHNYALKII